MEVWADCSACSCTHPAIAWLPLWCGGHFQAKSTSFRSPAAARSCGNAAFIVRHVHPSLMPHGMSQYKLLHVRIRSPRSQRKIVHGSGASEALPTIAPLEGPRIFQFHRIRAYFLAGCTWLCPALFEGCLSLGPSLIPEVFPGSPLGIEAEEWSRRGFGVRPLAGAAPEAHFTKAGLQLSACDWEQQGSLQLSACDWEQQGSLQLSACDWEQQGSLQLSACDWEQQGSVQISACDWEQRGSVQISACDWEQRGSVQISACDWEQRGSFQISACGPGVPVQGRLCVGGRFLLARALEAMSNPGTSGGDCTAVPMDQVDQVVRQRLEQAFNSAFGASSERRSGQLRPLSSKLPSTSRRAWQRLSSWRRGSQRGGRRSYARGGNGISN